MSVRACERACVHKAGTWRAAAAAAGLRGGGKEREASERDALCFLFCSESMRSFEFANARACAASRRDFNSFSCSVHSISDRLGLPRVIDDINRRLAQGEAP